MAKVVISGTPPISCLHPVGVNTLDLICIPHPLGRGEVNSRVTHLNPSVAGREAGRPTHIDRLFLREHL
jgi:hypothetical protein